MTVEELISALECFSSQDEVFIVDEDTGKALPILQLFERGGLDGLFIRPESSNMCTCGHEGGNHDLYNHCLSAKHCACARFTTLERLHINE